MWTMWFGEGKGCQPFGSTALQGVAGAARWVRAAMIAQPHLPLCRGTLRSMQKRPRRRSPVNFADAGGTLVCVFLFSICCVCCLTMRAGACVDKVQGPLTD